jgi:hypothetical protein
MPKYRVYELNSSGRIVDGFDIDCDDDAAAIDLAATKFSRNMRFEIWQGLRLVVSFLGKRDTTP